MNVRYGLLIILYLFVSITNAAQYVAGDLAPIDSPDGELNAADVLVLERFVTGEDTPTTLETLIGDIAPLNNPDEELNVADILILQRAISGDVTLDPVVVLPPTPTLYATSAPIINNLYQINGTATPNSIIYIYVNNNREQLESNNEGIFSTSVQLEDGNNQIYATESDGEDESEPSNEITISNIIESTEWSAANGVYQFSTDVIIAADTVLTIHPGTEVQFNAGAQLIIEGDLQIIGTQQSPVTFTSQSSNSGVRWSGIKINENSMNSLIDWAIIENATTGIEVRSSNTVISNSVIHNNENNGIAFIAANGTVTNNTISENGNGIYIHLASSPQINSDNIITNNNYGIYLEGNNLLDQNPQPVINNNQIHSNAIYNIYTDNFYQGKYTLVDVKNNWWGSTEISEIAAGILGFTFADESTRALVDFRSFLANEVGEEYITNYLFLPPLIDEHTTLSRYDKRYFAITDVVVKQGIHLTINERVQLRFGSTMGLIVDGVLKANGHSTFGGVSFEPQSDASDRNWQGIKINETSAGSEIYTSVIRSALIGIDIKPGSSNTRIRNNQIMSSREAGIYLDGASAEIIDNWLTSSTFGLYIKNINDEVLVSLNVIQQNNTGVFLKDASPRIVANWIRTSDIAGVHIEGTSNPVIEWNDMIGHGFLFDIIGGGFSSNNPQPIIRLNDINQGSQFAINTQGFSHGENVVINARQNWWGTTSVYEIARQVYDYTDGSDSSRPIIDFSEFLDDERANGSPVSGNYISPLITENTTFFSGQTYTATSDVIVAQGVTLTIEAGAVLKFSHSMNLIVNGSLQVNGTAVNPVVFSNDNGSWSGIKINSSAIDNVINWARIESAEVGVEIQAESNNTLISNSDFRNASVYAIYFNGVNGIAVNNTITNSETGIYIKNASPQIIGANEITLSRDSGILIEGLSNPVIQLGNVITGNTYGIYLKGDNTEANNPQPTINGNQLHSNRLNNIYTADFYQDGTVVIDATANWWNTVAVSDIATSIYDFSDGMASLPVVDFSGFLIAANGDSVEGNFLPVLITEDMTLTADSPYIATHAYVKPGVTLTIEPGAILTFGSSMGLVVDGDLQVNGTQDSPVTFISETDVQWSGIAINDGTTDAVIEWAIIENAETAIEVKAGSNNTQISHTVVRNNQNGIVFSGTDGAISNNTISDNENGIVVVNASPQISSNNITSNTVAGLVIEGQSNPVVNSNNIITGNDGYGIKLKGLATEGDDPQPIINGNEIHSNQPYNIYTQDMYQGGSVIINATGNWWNTVDVSEIADSIVDYTDTNIPSRALIDVRDFLDANGQTVSGNYLPPLITGNETLIADVPYLAVSDVIVQPGASLTIDPGVIMQFESSMSLVVKGELAINGASNNNVIIRSQFAPAKPWGRAIIVESTATNTNINRVSIENAVTGIITRSGSINTKITSSVFRNNKTGIHISQGSTTVDIVSSTIQDNETGIYFERADGSVTSNTIIENDTGLALSAASPRIQLNRISQNAEGIRLNGQSRSIIDLRNVITNNGIGIVMQGPLGAVQRASFNPIPRINNNEIHSNTTYNISTSDFYQGNNIVINALDNNWGNDDIDLKILDYRDGNNPDHPIIDYNGESMGEPEEEPIDDIIDNEPEPDPMPEGVILCKPSYGCSQDAFLVGAVYFQDINGTVTYYDADGNVLSIQYSQGKIIGSNLAPAYSEPEDYTGTSTTVVGSLGGEFSVSPSGAANYSIGIEIPPGTAGMQPQVGIAYDSQAGNGLLGMGWSLTGMSTITRCPKTLAQDDEIHGVDYTSNDAFCLDGQRLIYIRTTSTEGAEYRTETGNAVKALYSNNQFTVLSKDGTRSQYGFTDDSNIEAQGKTVTRVWAINQVNDQHGNYYTYTYDKDDVEGAYRILSINYTGNASSGLDPYASVDFVYPDDNRSDKQTGYQGGSKYSQLKRLSEIRVNHTDFDFPSRIYKFGYSPEPVINPSIHPSRLISVKQCSGSDESKCLAAHTINWKTLSPGFNAPEQILGIDSADGESSLSHSGKREYLADVTGDGVADRIWMPNGITELWVAKSLGNNDNGTSAVFEEPERWLSTNAAPDVTNYAGKTNGTIIDVNGDGKADRVWIPDGKSSVWVALSTGTSFSTPTEWLSELKGGVDVKSWDELHQTYADMNGDGLTDRIWAPDGRDEIWVALSDGTEFKTPTLWLAAAEIGGVKVTSNQGAHWFMLDINGDGMTDRAWIPAGENNLWVAVSTGTRFEIPTEPWLTTSDTGGTSIYSHYGRYTNAVDINGDGLQDYVWRPLSSSDLWVAISNGTSFETPSPWLAADTEGVPTYSWDGVSETYFDVNADGLSDKVWVPDGMDELWVAFSDGEKFLTPESYINSGDAGAGNSIGSTLAVRTSYADINGDGSMDRVWVPKDKDYVYAATAKALISRVSSIDNGAGIVRHIQYKSLTDDSEPLADKKFYTKGTSVNPTGGKILNPTEQDIQYPQYVVSEQSTTDGLNGTTTIQYRYGEAKVHLQGRGQLGFGWTESNNIQTGLITKVNYRQDYPFIGMVADETQTLNENILSIKTNTPNERPSDYDRPIPYLSTVEVTNNDINGNYLSTVTTTTTINENGDTENTTVETQRTNVANSAYTTFTTNVYGQKYYSRWHERGLVTQSLVYKRGPEGDSPTVTTNYTYYDQGKIKSESGNVSGVSGLSKIYTYDDFGHINSTTVNASDITERIARVDYNSTGQYAETVTNEMGHTSKITSYDHRFGVPETKEDANGLVTTYIYNDFGELTETRLPGGNRSVTTKNWCTENCTVPVIHNREDIQAQVAKYTVTTEAFGGTNSEENYIPDVKTFYDKLGREIRKRTTSYDGQVVYVDTAYDALGRVVATTQPYFSHDTSNKNPTITSYDDLGRPTSVNVPGEGISSISYLGYTGNGIETRTIKTFSNPVTGDQGLRYAYELKNIIGQVLQNTDNDGNVLYYEYDAQGNKVKTFMPSLNEAGNVINAKGTVITIGYDDFGRKTSMEDPNMGSWSYVYDKSSKLRRQTDAENKITTMEYDRLGRMTQRTDHDGTETNWVYSDDLIDRSAATIEDIRAGMAIGKLDSVHMLKEGSVLYRQFQTYTADLGLADITTTQIDGSTSGYVTQTTYDRFHRPEVVSYPETSEDTRLKLKYVYENGALNTVQKEDGSVTYWQAKHRDVNGAVRIAAFGNGIEQWRSYDVAGRLTWLNFGKDDHVINVNYKYDTLGNLVFRDSQRSGGNDVLAERYSYDRLNRLTNVSINSMVNQELGYDVLGNIRTKTGVNGYEYNSIRSGQSSARPHAISRADGIDYNYNNNGSIIDGGGRTVEWTSFNKPATISNTDASSVFSYGPSRARYKHQSNDHNNSANNSLTIYIGSSYERVTTGDGTQHKHYIKAGGETVAQYTIDNEGSAKTEYFHRDNQGSLVAVTDDGAMVKAQLDYDAFGQRRIVSGRSEISDIINSVPRGYTGHEHLDKLGLIHMNGRVYDPKLGRFLSADPIIQFSKNMQSYNRYSYVLNNPMSYTDPSGFLSKKLKKLGAIGLAVAFPGTAASISLMYSKPVRRLFMKHSWARVVGQIGSGVLDSMGCGGGCSAGFSAYITDISGGTFNDALRSAAISYATTKAFNSVHSKFNGPGFAEVTKKVLSHGAIGGIASYANGGKFRDGFVGAAVSQASFKGLESAGFEFYANPQGWDYVYNGAAASLVGGLASRAAGGSFEAGAKAALYGRLFNEMSSAAWHKIGREISQMGNAADKLGQCAIDCAEEYIMGVAIDKAGVMSAKGASDALKNGSKINDFWGNHLTAKGQRLASKSIDAVLKMHKGVGLFIDTGQYVMCIESRCPSR